MEREVDVLIVGAGPVGLTLAIALRRLSLEVRVLDKAPETKREPRAAVIWPRAAEVLADLGIADDFEKAANELHSVNVYGDGDHLGEFDVGHVRSAYQYPLVIEQHEIERLLTEHLETLGVRVEWNTEATDFRLFDDRAEVNSRRADGSRQVVQSAWVIGCEGTRSVIREKAGILFEGERRENLQVVQVNAAPTWRYRDSPDLGYFFLVPNASLGCFPIPGGGYRFFCFTTDPDPNPKGPPTFGEMRDLISLVAHAPGLELEPTEPLWISRARFQDRIAATLRRGRALLAGDAAHAWAPIGGHGMNAGIRGAHNLAWKLAAVHRGEARDSLLDTYSEEQRAAARAVIREMRFNVFERPNSQVVMPLLKALMPLGLSSGAFKQRIELALSDLGMHYRKSPLSSHHAGIRHLRAGDRVPDVAIAGSDGRRTRLHRLLSYDRWTLVLPPGHHSKAAIRGAREIVAPYRAPIDIVSVTPLGADAERVLPQDTMMLVRPDAHLGLLARSSGALEAYLDRWYAKRSARLRRAVAPSSRDRVIPSPDL